MRGEEPPLMVAATLLVSEATSDAHRSVFTGITLRDVQGRLETHLRRCGGRLLSPGSWAFRVEGSDADPLVVQVEARASEGRVKVTLRVGAEGACPEAARRFESIVDGLPRTVLGF
jgi:hypothetical protein